MPTGSWLLRTLSHPQYNPWAFYMAMSNHLRVNNDSVFLQQEAAASGMSVEDALEGIATDWQAYLIPGTHLIDYGPSSYSV